ncbi:MAG: hypothetical protein HFF11_11085 [Angelakisella sp.]|nr:hypothetical protein [Angelakisella sp.]
MKKREISYLLLCFSLFLFFFPAIDHMLQISASKTFSSLLPWSAVSISLQGCLIAVLCGTVWKAPPSFLLLLVEFFMAGYAVFISFFSGPFPGLNAHSPSYSMRFLFLGIIVTITLRTCYLFVSSK